MVLNYGLCGVFAKTAAQSVILPSDTVFKLFLAVPCFLAGALYLTHRVLTKMTPLLYLAHVISLVGGPKLVKPLLQLT